MCEERVTNMEMTCQICVSTLRDCILMRLCVRIVLGENYDDMNVYCTNHLHLLTLSNATACLRQICDVLESSLDKYR